MTTSSAVGEDLIARKITSPRRLGISGGSNGGLLMGVEMTQRPDLWHAVEIDVPLLDMLRIEKIAAGASWVGEYGSVSNPDELAFWEKTIAVSSAQAWHRLPDPVHLHDHQGRPRRSRSTPASSRRE